MKSLRGHHFLCTLHYRGAGYSTEFTDNFTALCHEVLERGSTTVEISEMADPICKACPQLQPDGQRCLSQASIMRRDQALLDAMGWAPGMQLSLEDAHAAVLARREELMETVCRGCEWLSRCQTMGPYGLISPLTRKANDGNQHQTNQ